MRRTFLVLLLLFSASTPAVDGGSSPPQPPKDAVAMDTIVVAGVQPGPGLWKVSKGDHVLWVLGTLSPLPEKMQWRADEVAQRIAESQALLKSPEIGLKADIGFFGQLALLPSLIGVRNNPDGKKLEDVVPPELYARWKPLKERYIGRGDKIEKWRPLFAAQELYEAAIRKNGMTVGSAAINDRIKEFARRAKIEPTPVAFLVDIDKPREAVKEFKKSSLDDIECFAKTLDRLETDLGTMKQRANAWATGDLDALRALPYTNQYSICLEAIQRASILHGTGDLDARVMRTWLDAATKTLGANASSFALLSMSHMFGEDGYLAKLRERGYAIEAPDADDENAAAGIEP